MTIDPHPMTDTPKYILAWKGPHPKPEAGNWTVERAPPDAVPYVRKDALDESEAVIAELEQSRDEWKVAVGHLLAAVPVSEIVGAGGSIRDLAAWMKERHNDTKVIAAQAQTWPYIRVRIPRTRKEIPD